MSVINKKIESEIE